MLLIYGGESGLLEFLPAILVLTAVSRLSFSSHTVSTVSTAAAICRLSSVWSGCSGENPP